METNTSKQLLMTIVVLFVGIVLVFDFPPVVVATKVVTFKPTIQKKVLILKPTLQTYIVHVRQPEEGRFPKEETPEDETHGSLLPSWYDTFLPANRRMYSYQHVASGFAAKLTAAEAEGLKRTEGVISVRPERRYNLHTTHSPRFLGLHQNFGFWNHSNYGKGVIIGVVDTGITPGHPSFSDEGLPPPPAKWKGKCEFVSGCNNKLIGARYFPSTPGITPADDDGHGTHTSSTAAGNFVKGANVYGNAEGMAAGVAPLAHVAMYKTDFTDVSILAAMDTAIKDGVDVLSLSLGGGSVPFYEDGIAIGAFAASRKGVVVSCSAANSGPYYFSLSNEAPWILTVGASTVDRTFLATAKLGGNGKTFDGETLFQPQFTDKQLPLVYAGAYGDKSASTFCAPGSLKNASIQGKVVLCERGGNIARLDKGQEVKDNGGAAMILMNQAIHAYSTLADPHVLPAIHLSFASGQKIKTYINSSSNPTATLLFRGTKIGKKSAPEVTSFSSRGPNMQSQGILKPDIIGPGVNILAAWPVSVENKTSTDLTFNVISGTSMSCPHLSGIAALLKSSHPDWSPAAIKSAIMTTADLVNLGGKPIVDQFNLPADIFATGAGHVHPTKANDPGLIYDLNSNDYIPYLCGLHYTDLQVEVIVLKRVSCAKVSIISDSELNYPSFSVLLTNSTHEEYTRTVTNVGPADSSYTVEVVAPEGASVAVSPKTITFTKVNQKATYKVTFHKDPNTTLGFSQGYLKWVSPKHSVRSAIAVIFAEN